MQIGRLKEIIKDYKDDEHIAIIFFEKDEAEIRYDLEVGDSSIDENWVHIVESFESDKRLESLADTVFDDAVFHNLADKE